MSKLHEILAVEKTRVSAAQKLIADTHNKFGKFDFFQGHEKTLKMIEDSPQNEAIENAARDVRNLPTTVSETLDYALDYWAKAEDVIFQKNRSNQYAVSDLFFRDTLVAKDVPVDELMGLESRLTDLRKVFEAMPTLVASTRWEVDAASGRHGAWVAEAPEVTTKTEKTTTPVVLYQATDKHPAQVKEVTSDKIVGTFTLRKTCGAATTWQKAESLAIIDELIVQIKQARMRANSVEANTAAIGNVLKELILKPFKV